MTRFQYPRHNLCIRVSTDLDKMIDEAAEALNASKTDVVIYALGLMLDASGRACPDVQHLPETLREDFRPRSRETFAGHFFEPPRTDSGELDVDAICSRLGQ